MSLIERLAIWALRRSREPRYPNEPRLYTGKTASGIYVTPDNALTVSAVWACCRYLSQMVAVPPWRVMRETPSGAATADKNPVEYLINKRPNDEWSSFAFRETLMQWALRRGNGYAEIERNSIGLPAGIWPIHPDRVNVERDQADRLVYRVNNGSGPDTLIPSGDMFHLRGFGDGPVGLNVMEYAAQSIGWAKATQLFGAAFFGNGANLSGVVSMKRPLTQSGLETLKTKFEELYQGSKRANKTAFLDNEMTYQPIGIEPEKGQFLETNQFQVEEICRWFGVPPHKIQHLLRATFANIEHQSIEVVTDSIMPWAKRFEEEADYKLFGPANRQGFFTKIYLQALLRGDTAARSQFYKTMREIGAFSINEILALEDMNTIGAEGDKRVMQSQFTTLDKIGEAETAPSAASPASQSSGDNPPARRQLKAVPNE